MDAALTDTAVRQNSTAKDADELPGLARSVHRRGVRRIQLVLSTST
jgi:hypothetical protein